MAKNRFEVSTEGMALLHDGRPLWTLVKELVANSWDESDVTMCEVDISPAGRGLITVTASDNGGGFSNIEDSFTLFGPTAKQRDAEVRGRFNLGEKELISVAKDAKIETVGHTVTFPVGGGRTIRANQRTLGTLITVTLRGRQNQVEPTIARLRSFLPPVGIDYRVNGMKIEDRKPFADTVATLPTIIATAPGQPIRRTERKTKLHLYTPPSGAKAQIYEMGIPIQKIDMPYDVNVMQKVPLPPNRDVVSPRYLQAIFAETLAVTSGDLDEDTASSAWVKLAVEDRDRTTDATVKQVMEQRFGEKTLISMPFDKDANEAAFSKGWDLINSKTLSPIERERYKENGLETAARFSLSSDSDPLIPLGDLEITDDMKRVGKYAQWLSKKLLGFSCQIGWYKGGNKYLACYHKSGTDGSSLMVFNVQRMRRGFLANAPTPEQTSLILHELSHQDGSDERSHGIEYVHTLEAMAGKLHHTVQLGDWKEEQASR